MVWPRVFEVVWRNTIIKMVIFMIFVMTVFTNTPAGLWHVELGGDVRREIRVLPILPMFMRIAKLSPSDVQATVAYDR